MNKRIVTLTLVVSLALAANAFASIEGAWTAAYGERNPDKLHFNLTSRPHSNNGMSMKLADFSGLTAAQVNASTMTPANFELRREAGTVRFEGTFRNGKGAGQFTFTENPSYLQSMRNLGVNVEPRRKHREQSEEESLLIYALVDVSTAFVKSMQAEGYRESLDRYLEMRIFDITPEYIREMRGLGFGKLDTDDLVATAIHKVTPAFVAQMKQLGYGKLDLDDLMAFRIHGVSAALINELKELGYEHVDADDLVAMRIHRVTPDFIRELKAAGYARVPIEKMISMRIAGIDAADLKKLRSSS